MTHKQPNGHAAILQRQLSAARYVTHSIIAHKYATAVAHRQMSLETAHEAYDEAMANYDGIVFDAISGAPTEANEAAMTKGADAINEMLESVNG